MITSYSLLGTGGSVQAAAADVSLAGHILAITGCPSMDYRMIDKMTIQTSVAETSAVWTITPTNAASTEFSLQITQIVPSVSSMPIQQTITHNTAASGSSATTICNAWRAALAATKNLQITPSGTTTLVLTAKAGSPIVKVVNASPSATITVTETTPGVSPLGTYAALVAEGVSGAVSGQSYTTVTFNYRESSTNDPAGNVSTGRHIHSLYINAGATNYAALATRLAEVRDAYVAGGTDADPEAIAAS